MHRFRYLHGQLTRGDQHQGHRLPALSLAGDALQNRQRERRCLAGPRRCLPEQIASLQQRRNRLALDRSGFLITETRQRLEQLGAQPQVGEGSGVLAWI
jgi:hypothetical protein